LITVSALMPFIFVAYPDPHAGIVKRLHAGVDLAVVELP
jgi:hypothetical protein